MNVVAEDKGILQTGYEAPGGTCGFELLDEFPPEATAEIAADRAIRMLTAKHAPAGKMPVVLMGTAGGTLIHEAVGHGLEADFIVKGVSVYAGKIGQKVASSLVTVIDDGSLFNKYGAFRFDDEGNPSKRNVVIENGILRGYLTDRYNADLLKLPYSGNGRRESFRTKPVPRMTNTYIDNDSTDPQEIISSVKNGLMVKKMGGGQVNVVSGDFVFDATECYLIENGKIGDPVRGASLVGNGPKILEQIDMVGTDIEYQAGVCGKYDHVPVGDGQPTLRIPEITVGGAS